jgi:transposase
MNDSSQRDSKREKLTAKEIVDIRKSIEQMESVGFTDEEIGSYLPKDWIPQLMEDPVDKRKQTRNLERKEQIKELLIKGMSMNKIAQELGVSIGTVQYWKEKIGPIETKTGRKKAKGEVDGEEFMRKWAEREKKVGDYWLREEELMLKDGLSGEQAEKQAREEILLKKKSQQDKEERKE